MATGLKRINNGKGHWYKLDGDKATGVTTLLSNGVPKPALINWSANTTAAHAVDNWDELSSLSPSQRLYRLQRARYTVLDKAARRGTEVHALAEKLMHGEEIDVPEAIEGHVDSYVRFLDEFEPVPVLTEFLVGSRKWRYCGTGDMVVDMPRALSGSLPAGRYIADIKTSRSGIYPETALQLAAYRFAEFYVSAGDELPVDELGIVGALGIWVREDGYSVLPITAGEREFRMFLHAATVARWAEDNRGLIGDAVSPGYGSAA